MAQNSFQARLREEFQASRSIVVELQDSLSLRDVRKLLADRLGAPQTAIDQEKKLIANWVDEAIMENSSAQSKVSPGLSNSLK